MKRDIFTMSLALGHELSIDSFAGGGGASTGMAGGLGREVDIAINHDGEALAMHAANHPGTTHYREDVFSVHPGFVTRQLPIGLAWFSPDCKHFSRAKGKKPVDKKIRGLAWVTVKWGTFQVPRCIMLENVEEFQDWGPLDEEGKPIKEFKGRTFQAFIACMTTGLEKGHPDTIEIYEALGHDFPIERLHAGLAYHAEWRVLRACDYDTPTIRKRLYIVFRRDGRPIVWPVPTHGDPKSEAVKSGKLLPWRTAAECIDWSIPCPSIFERKRPLKDATLRRIAKGIMKFVVNSDKPFIVKFSENSTGQQIDEPLHTVMAGAPRFGVVSPTLMHVTHHGADRNAAAEAPLATVTGANRGEQALITAHISTYYGDKKPGDVRGSSMRDPIATQTTENRHAVVSAFLAKHYGGHETPGGSLGNPASTITAVDHHAVVAANLVRMFGNSNAADVDAPVGAICAGGLGKTQLVASHLVKLRGTCQHGQPITAPAATISAQGTHLGEVRAFLIKYYSEGGQWNNLTDPMHTVPTKDRIGLVTIKGEDYAIVDIGMRMLSPRELARAQGFPDSYILDPIVNGKPLSKSAQVRMIGNSVCPPMAAALVRANFAHEKQIARVA